MRFKSSDGLEKRLALLSGHIAIVGKEWKELPPLFHSAAYAAGCISEKMVENTKSDYVAPSVSENMSKRAKQAADALAIIKRWIAENLIDNFNTDGRPKTTRLSDELGYRIYNNDRDHFWDLYLEQQGK